jgi:Peptidase M50B-like
MENSSPHVTSVEPQHSSKKDRWLLPLLALACVLAWDTPILMPLKILVVFFHEGSHALATILTGGSVQAMHLVANQGGQVISLGGWPIVIISAGYLGSLFWGALILVLAARSSADRWIMALLGIGMLLLTVLYVRNVYGGVFGLAGGIMALASAKFLSTAINDFFLKLIGIVTMLYVPLDIFSDTLARSELRSDARILAEYLGGTTMLWGSLWLLISLIVIPSALYFSLRSGKS